MLKLYHAEPGANSLKSLIPLKEKGLEFQSIYVDLHKFEQHEPWFIAINPDGQVPVLDHDGNIITHTTVINEYLEDAFPEAPALRPADPLGQARMRFWNKFVDEHVMNYVSMHGWHRFVGVLAHGIETGEFERLVARIPLHEQREKWRTARSGFSARECQAQNPRSPGQGRRATLPHTLARRQDVYLGGYQLLLPLWPVCQQDVSRPYGRTKTSSSQPVALPH